MKTLPFVLLALTALPCYAVKPVDDYTLAPSLNATDEMYEYQLAAPHDFKLNLGQLRTFSLQGIAVSPGLTAGLGSGTLTLAVDPALVLTSTGTTTLPAARIIGDAAHLTVGAFNLDSLFNGTAGNVSVAHSSATQFTSFFGSFSYSINGTNGDFLQSNGDGSNLTGFGPLARITPTGTADASHYLRGDNTWATIAAGNTVVTGTGLVSSGTGTVTFSIDPAQVYYSSGTVTVPSARVTGLAASATTDTTNAGNITSGTLSPTQGGSNTSIGTSPILPNSTFICEGDSITAGSAATPYSSVIGSLPDFAGKNIRILNVAIGATGMVTTVNSGTFTYILNASSGTVTLASGTVDNTFLWKHVTGTSVPTNTYVLARPDSTHLVLNNLPLTTGTQSLGFVGETLTTRYPYTVYPHRPTASGGDGGAASYLNVMVGANDTQTGTNWSSLISAYCTQARSDGFKVLLMTQLPHGGYHNDQNDLRLVINRSEATGTYWDYFLDMDTLFPNPFDTNFFLSDALHLNASAERLWASAIQSAYRSLSAAPAGMRYDLHAPQLVTFSLGSADYQTLCGPTNQRYIVPYSSFVFAQVGVMTAPHNVDLPILFGGLLNGTTVTVLDASGSCNAQHPITVRPTVGSGNTLNAATTNTVILNYPFASKTFLVNGTGYLADSDTTSTAAMTANSTGTITFNTGLRSERIYNTGTTTISTATITLPSPATANQVLEYQGGANITTVTMAGATVTLNGTAPTTYTAPALWRWRALTSGTAAVFSRDQ